MFVGKSNVSVQVIIALNLSRLRESCPAYDVAIPCRPGRGRDRDAGRREA